MKRSAHRCGKTNEAGFTLLELVVTLGLLSLIVAAIMGGLGASRRVWQMRGDLEQISALGAARTLLEARVVDAMPLWDRSDRGLNVPAFDGTTERLTFVSALARGPDGGGLVRQVIQLSPSATTAGLNDLVLDESRFGGAGDARAAPKSARRSVLVENVAQISFRYIGPDLTRAMPEWSTSWRRRPALPRLIGLTIAFPPGDLRHWPELMLAPSLGPAS